MLKGSSIRAPIQNDSSVTEKQSYTAALSRASAIGIITFLFITLFVFLVIYQTAPPQAGSINAPVTDFSSARAMVQLRAIAQKAHPTGSAELAETRKYILEEMTRLGLNPEVQSTSVVNNIVGRLYGTDNTKALLLVGHYDSVPAGPGASDDGSAVSSLLETARALKSGAPLRNDVIFLFTDGEEAGLLGAKAFVYKHPWAKDVGVFLNFDARGNRGPVLMFELSDQNGWLVEQFAKSAPYPVANSLMSEIYKALPNDTDFTIFKEAGFEGYNFAHIDGYEYYHSSLDTVENMDERTLQHIGSYALGLTRHLGNLNLEQTRKNDAVFFNVLGSMFVHYSTSWLAPLTIFAIILFAATTILGFKRKYLTLSGTALGFAALLLSIIGTVIGVSAAWTFINMFHGGTYNSHLYMISFAALAIGITSGLYIWFWKSTSMENLAVGGLLWWLILTVLVSLYLPGGSYMFTWPLIFSLIALGFRFIAKDQGTISIKHMAALCICAVPGIMLVVPMIFLIYVGLTLAKSAIVMIMVVLLLGLIIPHLSFMAAANKWALPVIMLLLSLGLIVGASASGLNKHPAQTAPSLISEKVSSVILARVSTTARA